MIPVFLANIYFTLYSLLCCKLSVLHRLWHTLSLLCSDLKQIAEGELLMKKIKQPFTIWDLNSPVLLSGWIIAQYSGFPVMGPACLSRAKGCGAPTSDLSLGNPALSLHCWLEVLGLLSQLQQSPAPTLPCRIQLGNQPSCCLFGCHPPPSVTLHRVDALKWGLLGGLVERSQHSEKQRLLADAWRSSVCL